VSNTRAPAVTLTELPGGAPTIASPIEDKPR
jgi:hypothetical protein